MTPLGFELVTSALIPLVGPKALPTFIKAIAIRKGAYPNVIVYSPKRPRHSNTKRVDERDQPSDLPTWSSCEMVILLLNSRLLNWEGSKRLFRWCQVRHINKNLNISLKSLLTLLIVEFSRFSLNRILYFSSFSY